MLCEGCVQFTKELVYERQQQGKVYFEEVVVEHVDNRLGAVYVGIRRIVCTVEVWRDG